MLHTYTFEALQQAAQHASGIATPDTGSTWANVVNDAAQYLAGLRPWNYRQKALVIDFTAYAITSLVRASNVVTGNRTAHGLAVGDTINVIGSVGANSFNGVHIVATVPTANTFTFNQTGTDETASTPGSYIPCFVNLPADFAQVLVIERRGSWSQMTRISLSKLTRYRAGWNGPSQEVCGFVYSITQVGQTSATTSPTWRMELYPGPAAAETAAIVGTYIKHLVAMSGNTDLPDMPAGPHQLALKYLCRAFAESNEMEQEGTNWQLFNRMIPKLIEEDGGAEGNLGQIQGGIEDQPMEDMRFYPKRFEP